MATFAAKNVASFPLNGQISGSCALRSIYPASYTVLTPAFAVGEY